MFAQGAQNRSRLRVNGREIVELAAKMNRAIGLEGPAEINLLARAALQVGKKPRRGVRVLINVAASSLAAAHALPAVKTAVGKTKAGRSRQNRSC